MKVLLTGGAGFIGSHIARTYLEAGHEVAVVDDLSHGKKERSPRAARLHVMDVRDKALKHVFEKFRPDVVNHHAAQINVRESVKDPVNDAQINILGSINLLNLCVETGVKKFIFASTGGAIYGEQKAFPANEEHPAFPLSPYGVAKLAVEKYMYVFNKAHGLDCVSLRYSNVYGPGQDPYGEAGVIAIFCERLIKGKPVVINGSGEQTRDFVFVEDVVTANLLALDKKISGEINIATGIETTINEIFKRLKGFISSKVEESHGPAKAGENMRSVLDITRAKEELGWQPGVSLDEGLKRTVDFFLKETGKNDRPLKECC